VRRRRGVAIVLLDERLGVARSQLGDDPPVVAPPRKLLVGVLDPDNGDPFPPRLLDKAADVRDDRVALVSPLDDAVLHVDDEECGVRPVLECGHGLPLLTLGSRAPPTLGLPTDSGPGRSMAWMQASGTKDHEAPGRIEAQASDTVSDLGLRTGAGDENRTRAISLGNRPIHAATAADQPGPGPPVAVTDRSLPWLIAR